MEDLQKTGEERERAILFSVRWGDTSMEEAEESLLELRSLAKTAGASVAGSLLQSRLKPDPATLMGKGKLEDLSAMVADEQADLVVCDRELTPSQQRNLENHIGLKVVDRTALILDIFALHAHSKEGKAQVEMAQLRYGLSRLAGRGTELSRLGGGIGTRGPGETKLEVDRRRINIRIKTLDRELRDLSRVRTTKRKRRERLSTPTFALIGYTNAGKSSILNALTGADVVVEDQLFSTLDPITRRITLPGNQRAVVTDTVGFINHLPHQLVESFKSTLEEVKEADMLLHVIDSSATNTQSKITAVDEVLDEIGAGDIPTLYILNKTDLLEGKEINGAGIDLPHCVVTSALTGEGLDILKQKMSASLPSSRIAHLLIPHHRGDLISLVYSRGYVRSKHHCGEGLYVTAELPEGLFNLLEEFIEESGFRVNIDRNLPGTNNDT